MLGDAGEVLSFSRASWTGIHGAMKTDRLVLLSRLRNSQRGVQLLIVK
jgi:hypothetical protein